MANHHFGKFADVWKHLVLTEVLSVERPTHYAETHAGSAVNPMVDDSERAFGVSGFLGVADRFEGLATCRYRVILEQFGNARDWYPGSAALAMTELGNGAEYVFCDQDPHSAADLENWAAEAGIGQVDVRQQDGMTAVGQWLRDIGSSARPLVHVDPFDPYERGPSGRSAVEFAGDLVNAGQALVYWYGYDSPTEAWWPYRALERVSEAPLWCGDVMVLDAEGEPGAGDGNLGRATTAGTGCGVLLANVSTAARAAGERLGRALEAAYADARLPDGSRGRIRFGCVDELAPRDRTDRPGSR